eukprot:364487-Chlamydomonas_euryale.AAC.40
MQSNDDSPNTNWEVEKARRAHCGMPNVPDYQSHARECRGEAAQRDIQHTWHIDFKHVELAAFERRTMGRRVRMRLAFFNDGHECRKTS